MSSQRLLIEVNRSGPSNSSSPEHPGLQLLPFVRLLFQHPRLRHVERGNGRQIPGPRPTLYAHRVGPAAGKLQRRER